MKREIIYLTLEDFENVLKNGEYDIIAVKMNDLFLNNYDMSSFHKSLVENSNYYIFNKHHAFKTLGGFSDDLKGEDLVERVYIISEPLTSVYNNMINDVMILNEAAKMWGLTEGALRKAIQFNRFKSNEYRKSGRITLITKQGMERVYGKMKVTKLEKVTYDEMESFIIDNMESNYNVMDVLIKEISELDNNCEMVFEMYDCKFKISREVTVIDEDNEEFIDLFNVEKI